MKSKKGSYYHSPLFAGWNAKRGVPSPLHNHPMRGHPLPHRFVRSPSPPHLRRASSCRKSRFHVIANTATRGKRATIQALLASGEIFSRLASPARLPRLLPASRVGRDAFIAPPSLSRVPHFLPASPHSCHCEPVTDVTGVAIRLSRPCHLARPPSRAAGHHLYSCFSFQHSFSPPALAISWPRPQIP